MQRTSFFFCLPESIFRDRDNALRTSVGGERRGVIQRNVAEGGQVEALLEVVEQPGAGRAAHYLNEK